MVTLWIEVDVDCDRFDHRKMVRMSCGMPFRLTWDVSIFIFELFGVTVVYMMLVPLLSLNYFKSQVYIGRASCQKSVYGI